MERLLEQIVKAGDEALRDDLVHDLKGDEASAVNNGGARAQVEYLVSQIGAGEAARHIGEALANDADASEAPRSRQGPTRGRTGPRLPFTRLAGNRPSTGAAGSSAESCGLGAGRDLLDHG